MSDYSDIQTELDALANAVYGEEVRSALISIAKKVHDLATPLDASSATSGQVPTADGEGSWEWAEQSGSSSESTGWSDTAKALLITILNECLTGTDQQSNISALETALATEEESDSIILSASSGTLSEGNTRTITATVTGSGTLAVTSSNTSVATVSISGTAITMTAVSEGSATITATYGSASATYALTVTAEATTVSVSLSPTSGTVTAGDTTTATITTTGSATLSATSSDTSVATASISGSTLTVTGVAEGSATITVSYGTATATYTATVEAAASGEVAMTYNSAFLGGAYSDDGSTSVSASAPYQQTYKYVSDDAFASDTTVTITFTSGSLPGRAVWAGCVECAPADLSPSYSAYYCEELGSITQVSSGKTYTVKAGYHLVVMANLPSTGSYTTTCTVTT